MFFTTLQGMELVQIFLNVTWIDRPLNMSEGRTTEKGFHNKNEDEDISQALNPVNNGVECLDNL